MRTVTYIMAGAAAMLGAVAFAQPIDLPVGDVPVELSDAESEVVVNTCSACHSLDYITTQPRGKGAQFWRDSVNKMITVYSAPISPEDADAISAVLAKKFG